MSLALAKARSWRFVAPSVLPGFAPAFACTLLYLCLIVLLPISALAWRASGLGLGGLLKVAMEPRVAAGLWTSFSISLAAATIDVVFGFLAAWALTRYRFPGRGLLDAAIDLPFALPTAVAGISLAALYGPKGFFGEPLLHIFGLKVAFTRAGILVALIFVGLPFIVRTVQPVLLEFEPELEEAAATLGASRTRAFWRVILPPLLPALLTGFALAFARAVGEYGSVIFIAGNIAYVSEIAPLLIVVKLEQYDYAGATGIATIMLLVAFFALLAINLIQAWSRKRLGHV
jgi:sulfate transport system permease protein